VDNNCPVHSSRKSLIDSASSRPPLIRSILIAPPSLPGLGLHCPRRRRGGVRPVEVRRLAAEQNATPAEIRHQLLTAMTAVPQPHRGLDELDWHRILDALVLVLRPR
jgi:hypothetical protein